MIARSAAGYAARITTDASLTMSIDREAQEFLQGLLMTNHRDLRFLHRVVMGGSDVPSPEDAVLALSQSIAQNRGNVPNSLANWLKASKSLAVGSLTTGITLAGLYRDERLVPTLEVILRQLSFVAAHPAAVSALARSKGVWGSKALTEILWASPPAQWQVREPAILRELGRIGRKSSINDLIKALKVPHDNPVRAAAAALASYPPDDVLGPLVDVIRSANGSKSTGAAGAAEALGLLGDDRARSALQTAHVDGDSRLAIAVAVALARLGSGDAVDRLVELARHQDIGVRARALGALGLAGTLSIDSVSISAVLKRGLSDSQPEVRTASATALGQLQDRSAAQDISTALGAEVSPLVRKHMVRALGRVKSRLSLPALERVLSRDDDGVRVEAMFAVANFRDPALARLIVPFRNSPHPKLAQAAAEAIRRLLHRPFVWPDPREVPAATDLGLYTLRGARQRLLPPPVPPPEPGFFGRLFGAKPAPTVRPPKVIGSLKLSDRGVGVMLNGGEPHWKEGMIDWSRRFSAHITRDLVSEDDARDDIGIHITLRQRPASGGSGIETVAVSLWCTPTPLVGGLQPKTEQLPCLDPHQANTFLAALRFYAQVHGVRIEGLPS